jgi:tetratricopeptide (TPR) repeat protein
VAAALAIQIDATRLRRARRRPVADLAAYDLFVRGMERLRGGSFEDDLAARRLFERARELEPSFARAQVGLSLSYFNDWSCQAWERWDENETRAFEHARAAVELDEGDAVAHMVLGRILLYRRRFDAAERHVDLALRLNPNDAELLIQLTLAKALLGEGTEAVALAEKAMRLHPLHPDWYFALAALSHLIARELRSGIALARKAWKATVDLPAFVAAALAELGEREAATEHLRVFREEFREKVLFGREPEPGEGLRWILDVNPLRRDEDAAFLVQALRKAGLDEDPDDARRAAPLPLGPGGGGGEGGAGRGPAAHAAVFRRDGDEEGLWRLVFQGEEVTLADVKGFRDLARLLAQPGVPVHAIELADRVAPAHDDEPVLDARARREMEGRIRELQQELDAAEQAHDLGRAERARAELERLVDELARSLGLGGRTRRLGSAGERARTAVTWRIRSAIKKIARAHPALGRHLENAVRTGTTCVYRPEAPVDWEL